MSADGQLTGHNSFFQRRPRWAATAFPEEPPQVPVGEHAESSVPVEKASRYQQSYLPPTIVPADLRWRQEAFTPTWSPTLHALDALVD